MRRERGAVLGKGSGANPAKKGANYVDGTGCAEFAIQEANSTR
jgi:hypothetical protein